MMVVRNSFIAKPGNAGKLAQMLKETGAAAEMPNFRVLTDVTGNFNRVVLEYEVQDLSEFEARMKEYMSGATFKEKMAGYTELWLTGTREILRVV